MCVYVFNILRKLNLRENGKLMCLIYYNGVGIFKFLGYDFLEVFF